MVKTELHSEIDQPSSDFEVRASNLERENRATRLREAARKAGGNKEVARRSGVPLGTLNAYIAGGEMKLANAVALARACGVSLEWLATDMESAPAPAPPVRKTEDASVRLFSIVNVDKLAGAMEAVADQFRRNHARPTMHQLAQGAILLYDLMSEPASQTGPAPHPEKDKHHE